ncbi:hypothetical protein NKI36_04970 [Mesorhizobium caraganae]|uniref:DNA-binding protein n=1 Tax=Mesorhizobium caraganae TaxID=483206 RepID=A0ABV1YV58_9HYPH
MQTNISSNYHFEEKEVGQLDSWTPKGIAKHVDMEHFYTMATTTSLPPWRPIPSRLAARFLGTSIQSLANWRMRDLGPATEPMRRGQGNRIYYRPDKIAEWLSGGKCSDWQFSALWLRQMGMPLDVISEDAVQIRIAQLEAVNDLSRR